MWEKKKPNEQMFWGKDKSILSYDATETASQDLPFMAFETDN